MADLGSAAAQIVPGGKSVLFIGVWIVIALVAVVLIFGGIWFVVWQKRRYALQVEIKMTRSDGRITNGEWGRGLWDPRKGVVFIKRPKTGMRKGIPMKIFDIRKYLQGNNLLTVIQVGPEDFRPVLNDSWSKHILVKNGKKYRSAIINIKTETEQDKAWKAAWEEAAKSAYTISNFLKQFQTPIAIGIVVLCCFIGFAILWTKLSGICN